MLKRMNKKGQELSITTLVLLVLAVIILVVVVLGFTKGWNYIFDKIGLLPNDLEAAVSACTTYAGSESQRISYCQFDDRDYRFEGTKQYANCDYVHELAGRVLGADKVGFSKQVWCASDVATKFCAQLKAGTNYKADTIVNGKPCSEFLAAGAVTKTCKAKAEADKVACEAITIETNCIANTKCKWE